ncbi:MAG: carbohydrate ABC transporter permease [Clostridiales bacterium]|nr:carbohydrate ABC transporter permease [Clostridiales bacterium]
MKYNTRGYRVFTVFNYLIMLVVIIVMVFPYLNVVAKALNESKDTVLGGITVYPRKPTLQNFKALFSDKQLLKSAVNTLIRVVIGTIFSLTVQFLAAYALSQRNLVGKNWFLLFFIIPMFFNGGLIPQYLLYSHLGLLNNFLVYLLPGAFSFFNAVIIRTYIHTIPGSLSESAKLDGANHLQILTNITLPLCVPILATVTLWVAVGHWNDWTTTLYFVTKPDLYTLQYVLMQVIRETDRIIKMIQYALQEGLDTDMNLPTTPEALRAAQIVVVTLPIILLYPFLQRYFIHGITIGAVKE